MSCNSAETKRKRNKKRREIAKTIDKNSFELFIMRKCRSCQEEKLCRHSGHYTMKGKPIYRTQCNECWKQYEKKYKKKNRSKITKNKKQRIKQNKIRCIEYLGGGCKICGYNKSIRALTFHHISREDKIAGIATMLDHKWENLKCELNKCILLCFNCHMEMEESYENNKS